MKSEPVANWETVSKKAYWDRNVSLDTWRSGIAAGHRSYLPDAIKWLTAREFVHFYGIAAYTRDWPRLRACLPEILANKSGSYDLAWSCLAGGGWNLKPAPDFYEMPERQRQFLVAACKTPGQNIYQIGKALGMQYRRAHDHATTLVAQGKLQGRTVTENGRQKVKLYPAYKATNSRQSESTSPG